MAAYQYSIMVQTMTTPPGVGDATGKEVGEGLAVALAQRLRAVSEGIDSFEGGDWEIFSHDLTRLDRHLVLSVLLRRAK